MMYRMSTERSFVDISYADYKAAHMKGLLAICPEKNALELQSSELWIIDCYKMECTYNKYMRDNLAKFSENPRKHFIDTARQLYIANKGWKARTDDDDD